MSERFPKSLRLRQKRQYQEIARSHQKHVGRWIILEWRFSRSINSRLGITVSKKYGKAHERCRFKRIVREAFRLNNFLTSARLDLVVKPRAYAKNATCQDISHELNTFSTQFLNVPSK